jgi:glycosyltransferase involved in cell wall biosynthesis
MPRKVLVITYYWPPAGGIAVQRWVKFCKYLGENGWQPIVYTVSNGHYPLTDNSMLKDIPHDLTVIKQPIWEPYELFQLFSKEKKAKVNPGEMKGGESASLLKRISIWVRSNFFIPDARKFWIRPSVKFLHNYLKENPVDALVSTGPPHSAHLIALGLRKKNNLPWLADFRDPWTTMDYYQELSLTNWADRRHHRLEREVLTTADAITVVGRGMKEEFETKRGREVAVITNGFDETDFSKESVDIDKDFSFVHIGSFQARINPTGLWQALAELKNENHPLINKLKIKLTGSVAAPVIQSIKDNGLEEFLSLSTFQPHDEAIKQMKSAAVLLLCVYEQNKFIVTGKIFEYLAAKRPILYTGSKDGDAAQIILETETGPVFTKDEVQPIKKHIQFLYEQFERGDLNLKTNRSEKYSHRMLVKKVATELDRITTK